MPFIFPAYDDKSIAAAKSILRQSKSGELFPTQDVAPSGSLVVLIASDLSGEPILAMNGTPEAGVNLPESEQVSLKLRDKDHSLTVYGRLNKLGADEQKTAAARFFASRPTADHGCPLFRLSITKLVSSTLGQQVELDVTAIVLAKCEELAIFERRAVDHMNDDHLDAVKNYAEILLSAPAGEWKLASLDLDGLDLICGQNFKRLWFSPPLQQADEVKKRLIDLAILAKTTQTDAKAS